MHWMNCVHWMNCDFGTSECIGWIECIELIEWIQWTELPERMNWTNWKNWMHWMNGLNGYTARRSKAKQVGMACLFLWLSRCDRSKIRGNEAPWKASPPKKENNGTHMIDCGVKHCHTRGKQGTAPLEMLNLTSVPTSTPLQKTVPVRSFGWCFIYLPDFCETL